MDRGMATLLTIGWLVLGGYLTVLLAVSAVIAVVETVRSNFRRWTINESSRFRSQA